MENKLFTFDETINAVDKFYLADIIKDNHYRDWFNTTNNPKIFILNKGMCGNGGTTGFIRYAKKHNKGMYVLVPNVSIVQSKEIDDELCCVYSGATNIDGFKPIKLSTWDSGVKIIEKYPDCGIVGENVFDNKVWKNSLLVIDEYHKLIDDSEYREVTSKIIKMIVDTNLNVVLMSATPNYDIIEYFKKYSHKEVVTITINYDTKYKNTQLNFCENYRKPKDNKSIKNIINAVIENKNNGEHICIFYNSVKDCNNITFNSVHNNDIEILCSKTRKDDGICNYSESFNAEKHIHFMTSAFFTGMDINVEVGKVIIIGGNYSPVKTYTATEIKQMLGRFRYGFDNVFVIKENKNIGCDNISTLNSKESKNSKIWAIVPDKQRTDIDFIPYMLESLQQKQKIDAMEKWDSLDSFKKMMEIYPEFFVIEGEIPDVSNSKRRKQLKFEEFKQKLINGEGELDYKYKRQCEKYIEINGIEKFKNAGRNDILYWYDNVWKKSKNGEISFENLTKEELFDIFLDDGIFTSNYLNNLMNSINAERTDNLAFDVSNAFGCVCGFWDGNYIVLRLTNFTKSGEKISLSIYRQESPLFPKTVNPSQHLNISQRIRAKNKTEAITTDLFTTNIRSVNNIISSSLNNDSITKESVKKKQTLISEFYKKEHKGLKYRHVSKECTTINSLVIDIDNSISFNEFKDMYKNVHYIAYPSISNTNGTNWNKYRAIFPIDDEIEVPNEDLNVLKVIRRMVCPYEDKKHNLGAYVNKEQWESRYENVAVNYTLTQDVVDWISTKVSTMKEYITLKMSKHGKITSGFWTLERAVDEMENVEKEYKTKDSDGKRHTTTYKIKIHLDNENRAKFRQWLKDNYPNTIKHWDSHKI